MLGTLGYMAPEQVRGERADSRADIFAFGCVLHEMLSGRRAFTGTTSLDTMSAILEDAPEPIETTTTRVIPPAIVRIVDRCLEKTPAARFQTTTDLAFAWSPDRRHVAYERGGRLFAADVDVGAESEVGLSTASFDSALSLDWSPDGTCWRSTRRFRSRTTTS